MLRLDDNSCGNYEKVILKVNKVVIRVNIGSYWSN